MLDVGRFDSKTGKPIEASLEGRQEPAIKQVEHSYLEHWLKTHGIDAQFSVARFYESVNDSDRLRLESEGEVLAFTSGSEGYFTDPATAQLMTLGDPARGIAPVYASDRNSPHNSVAYGALIVSDGFASTTLPSARVLVIDDKARSHGDEPLLGKNGQPISGPQLEALYDKMGDGTMLVSTDTMQSLQTSDELERIALRAAEKSGVSGDISALAQELSQADTAAASSERQEEALARRSVLQFRAASPELPGIAKGTMASSQWCERLGVDAILSSNDIKGDDGRLSAPGIKEVNNFWINRKAIAQYGQQAVGPQVKYTIPEATRLEINPKVQAQAEELAQVAGDFAALSQRYIEQKERDQSRPYQDLEDEALTAIRSDWLYDALSADKYGQLNGQAKVVDGLNRYTKGDWLRLAVNGTSVPSAMAQHHSQLKPWEVCNKDLPHGAIVAYYRSPFPNVGAAAIAINNTEVIRAQDREAFSKHGVAYLPPWTAKNIAITDFDGDMNGFFVGYQATVPDLPEQIRAAAELASLQRMPPEQQYQKGRALFADIIQQHEQGQESVIKLDQHPLAVKEFAERNAPDVKPPEIVKQKKEKHPWHEGESHAAATWRAWEVTADNPTGKVANAGMSLQSLALELRYAPVEKQEALLSQVSEHFAKLLEKVDAGEVSIPDDDWLTAQGFSPSYRERIEEIAEAKHEIGTKKDPQQRRELTDMHLERASDLFSEVANGPNAVNLQTAVDTAKSAKGVDEGLHNFVMALQYKPDVFRRNKDNPDIYVNGKAMPTNTEEPVAWGVRAVNENYRDTQLEARRHHEYETLFPKADTKQQERQAKAIIQNHNPLLGIAIDSKVRQRQRRPEDQKPTLQVTLTDGRQFELQNIHDERGTLPIWRAEGVQPDWNIRVSKDSQATSGKCFPAELTFVDSQGNTQTQGVGFVSTESAQEHNLQQRLQGSGRALAVAQPYVTRQVPWAQQNDTDMLFELANRSLDSALEPPVGQDPAAYREATATALWRQSDGRHIVMKRFPDILSERLGSVETTLTRLQQSGHSAAQLAADGPRTIQFSTHTYINPKGESITRPSVSIAQPNGEMKHLGVTGVRKVALPEGATYMAAFHSPDGGDGVIQMQLMDLPTVQQTPAEVAAMAEGRRHLTFDFEPHDAYGIREGDIVIAQAAQGGGQVALQVRGQHRIDERLAAAGAQRWADAEKTSPAVLSEKLTAARSEGKQLWGLNVQPLGTYAKGQITPFPAPELTQQVTHSVEKVAPIVDSLPQEKPASLQLWECYNRQNSGVLAAVAANNPSIRLSLDQAMAKQAIQDGHPARDVEDAIAQHSPLAQQNSQPQTYAKAIVEREIDAGKGRTHIRSSAKAHTPARRTKAKDNGLGY